MKKIFFALILAVALFASGHKGCEGDDSVNNKFVVNELSISGLVLHPLKLTLASLRELNATEVKKVALVCGSGETKETVKSYKGVKLIDLLDKAVVRIDEKHGQNKTYIVATASDGYEAVFSYQELFNSSIGDKVIVFYEKNGSLLGSDEGCFGLISANDTKTGPRHIKWLKSIEVFRIK